MSLASDYAPPSCTAPNEELACVRECPPERTCRNREIQFSCLDVIKECTQKCVCKKGFFRNADGTCITGAQCDQCSGPNEYFSCDSECDNECKNLATQNRTNCPIKNIMCNKKCYCEDGYARDLEKKCVPVDKCPKPHKKCGRNEHFSCEMPCPPQTCMAITARFKCDGNQTCVEDCHCMPGFRRNEKEGKKSPCIPNCQCPQLKGTPECVNGTVY